MAKAKRPRPSTAADADGLRVFPHELGIGDRVTVGGTEWEVAATPTGYLKGKMVTVRLRKPGEPTVTDVEHWPAHERVMVRRAPASADPGPSPR
jgi:hypothetical protein